jgi:hypothetical protein
LFSVKFDEEETQTNLSEESAPQPLKPFWQQKVRNYFHSIGSFKQTSFKVSNTGSTK